MSIGLIITISTQKELKTYKKRVQNSTFWALITPPNRHIASPLAMQEENNNKKKTYKTITKLYYKVAVQKGCEEECLTLSKNHQSLAQ